MGNLALDYEKKTRLEDARMQPALLNKNVAADNYPKGTSIGSAPSFARQENLRLGKTGVSREEEGAENVAQDRVARLEQARGAERQAQAKASLAVKDAVKSANPTGAVSLLKQVDLLGDMPMVAALGAALLKDFSDLVFNVVLIGGLFSILCSIFIFMMMFLAGAGEKRKAARGLMKKGLFLVAGGLADGIPGLGFLPIETLTVGVVYLMILAERKAGEN